MSVDARHQHIAFRSVRGTPIELGDGAVLVTYLERCTCGSGRTVSYTTDPSGHTSIGLGQWHDGGNRAP